MPNQLSLFDSTIEYSKSYFLDVFAEAFFDSKHHRMKLKTINGHDFPEEMTIRVPMRSISSFPPGTIYKLDARLVNRKGSKPYFVGLKTRYIPRAVEFFDYNLKIQKTKTAKIRL